MNTDYIDITWDKLPAGERFIAIRTDVLRRYPFPEIKHTDFVPEGLIWLQLPGLIRFVNEPLRIYYKDEPDNITGNRWKRSWRGLLYYYGWLFVRRPKLFLGGAMSALERIINRGSSAMMGAAYNLALAKIYRIAGKRYINRPVHNYRMRLDLDDPGISRALIMYGERELDHKFMLERYLRPGMRIFDIGGNIGYYPLLELQITKGMGHIVIFEPVAENFFLLCKNLQLNGYLQDYAVPMAVSDETTVKTFYESESSNLGTFHPVGEFKKSTVVKTISYDDAVKKFGKPDLIRMDIEGHEFAILECVRKSDTRPIIIFETHYDRYSLDINFLLFELFKSGYHCPMISSANDAATAKIIERGYTPGERIRTDATYRTIFTGVERADLVDFMLRKDGARTVILAPA